MNQTKRCLTVTTRRVDHTGVNFHVLVSCKRFYVPLSLRIMVRRNFLPALSMELFFLDAALKTDLMLATTRGFIRLFLRAVCIRGMAAVGIVLWVRVSVPEHTKYKQL